MLNELEKVKEYLDSSPILDKTKGNSFKKNIIDNRLELIKRYIESISNKDANFYSKLIELLSIYIDKLYDCKFADFSNKFFDKEGNLIEEYPKEKLKFFDEIDLEGANRDFSRNLFDYVCMILDANEDIVLDIETLKRLLNRNPKPFTLSVELDYTYRTFKFKKLAKIINKNKTLVKSNITIDDIYQILIDTYQLDNYEVFGKIITPEDFKTNNKKIINFLKVCNSSAFVEVTDIIISYFDKEFDRLKYIKEKLDKNYAENLIVKILKTRFSENDVNLVHQLLNDESISIDYGFSYYDYYGHVGLKDSLAFSKNRTLIRDLLSRPEGIENCYFSGDWKIQLYRLYAIIGEYEKALEIFSSNYDYSYDFTEDFTNGFNKDGYAYGEFAYSDSLVNFVKDVCNSLSKDELDYSYKKDIINRVLNSSNVKYINLEEIMPIIKEVLSDVDYEEVLKSLIERYNSSNLGFIAVKETRESTYCYYTIRILNESEVQITLEKLRNNDNKHDMLVRGK